MDLLNKACAQAADLFKSMTPGARISAVLLVVVTLVSLAYLMKEQVAPGDTYLMGGEIFSASQSRSMHAALGKAGLEASMDGARIKVARGQESKAMAALAEAGALPIDFNGYLEKAVGSSGLLSLGGNQAAAMRIAKQRELQNIINTMVEKSAVLIDEQSDRGFPPKNIITASVSIQPRENQRLDESRIPSAIRYLVASSVAGLKPEAVTVVDLSNGRAYAAAGGRETPSAAVAGDYAEVKRRYERQYQQKISQLLAPYIPGVLVTTSVELDPEGGRQASPIDEDASNRPPRRVAVSVAVPTSYYETIWRRARPSAEKGKSPDLAALTDIQAAERKKIEQLVVPLLPPCNSATDTSAQLAVSTFYQLDNPPPPDFDFQARSLAWLGQHGNTLGVIALALVGLLALRSMIKSISATAAVLPPGTAMATSATIALAAEGTAGEPAESTPRSRLRRPADGPSLRDELADIVREDPEAAVSVLRTWIGNAK
jgi:flagellar biosynthesis/type III secretory pathway M-ring protein FliF/YscJ